MLRIDLNEVENKDCLKRCSKEKRKNETINDLCTLTMSSFDNLAIRCVGSWAQKKIFHLIQYFGIFSNGMKNKWRINYIEICSGPGRCVDRTTGKEFDGTALAVLKHNAFQNINKAFFFDYDDNVVHTINERIKSLNINNAYSIKGDYNNSDEICDILKNEVNNNQLNLVFIDPTDCSVPFELIKKIKKTINYVDMIINVASGTDINRNIINTILKPNRYSNVAKKYKSFLNYSDFFEREEIINLAKNNDNQNLRIHFREEYRKQMENIGFEFSKYHSVEHYYDILFLTSNERGIDFWDKAHAIGFTGQRELGF